MHVSCIKQIIYSTQNYYYNILQLQCDTNLLIIPDDHSWYHRNRI